MSSEWAVEARTVRLAVRVDPQALHGVAPRAAADRDVADHGAHRNRVRDQTRVVFDLGLRQRAGALTDLRVGPCVAVGAEAEAARVGVRVGVRRGACGHDGVPARKDVGARLDRRGGGEVDVDVDAVGVRHPDRAAGARTVRAVHVVRGSGCQREVLAGDDRRVLVDPRFVLVR